MGSVAHRRNSPMTVASEQDVHSDESVISACPSDDVFLFPASYGQQRLWFLNELDPGNPSYNMPAALQIEGPLHVDALEQSLQEIVRRHESLRTTIPSVDGAPVQVIDPVRSIHLHRIDVTTLDDVTRISEVQRLARAEARQPFDLARGPLLRTTLIKCGEKDFVLLLTIHHIICDGWSMGILIREIVTCYEAFRRGQPSPLADMKIQYADYTEWQQNWLSGQVLDEQLAFWKSELSNRPGELRWANNGSESAKRTMRGSRGSRAFPRELSQPLSQLANAEQATDFMCLLAAFSVLLFYCTGQDDILVGTDVANRNHAETENLIGILANQLVLRIDLAGNPTFRELVRRARKVVLGAYDHQDLPFDLLVQALNPNRNANSSPLFEAKFVLQNTPAPNAQLNDLSIRQIEADKGTARFDFLLTMRKTHTAYIGTVEYRSDLFEAATVTTMLAQLEAILGTVAASPDTQLSEVMHVLDEEQRRQQKQNRQAFREARRSKFGSATRNGSIHRESRG